MTDEVCWHTSSVMFIKKGELPRLECFHNTHTHSSTY